jgi:hypothetical protein
MHGRHPAWLAVALALLAPAGAAADTFTVTTTRDGGGCDPVKGCTLRGALDAAADGDAIRVPAGDYRLTQGPLSVEAGVTIAGDGADRTRVLGDAEQGIPVFEVDSASPVEIAHLTIRDGTRVCGSGGNVLNRGTLHLHHVAVRAGRAATGGGVANFGRLTIDHSLIDGNTAGGCDGPGSGGGIAATTGTFTVSDSTIAFNTAADGAGAALTSGAASLDRVTVARNHADGLGTGGLAIAQAETTVRGSLIAANTATVFSVAAVDRVSNCDPEAQLADGGGNLADSDQCFAAAPADPGLSDELIPGLGETPLLTIPAGSPAVDAGGLCHGSDQRDLARPQGDACDAGAYEVAAPAIQAATTTTAAPVAVRAPQPAAIAQTPVPTPTPQYRSRVVVKPTSGTVRVKLSGTRRYVDLEAVDAIPFGASIDARKGRVRLYAIATRGGKVQAASFYGGVFAIHQVGHVIELQLSGPAPTCTPRRASASAKRKHKRRKLWGSGKGRFRTRGHYSAATIRGTKWLVVDRCRSTTTRVVRGVVAVRDFRRHRTILVRAGERYVARKRG